MAVLGGMNTRFRWWFQIFFIFTPTLGDDLIWIIFFKWVETTKLVVFVWGKGWKKVFFFQRYFYNVFFSILDGTFPAFPHKKMFEVPMIVLLQMFIIYCNKCPFLVISSYLYSFSHNHGSVENGYIWKVTTIGGTHFWLPWLWEEVYMFCFGLVLFCLFHYFGRNPSRKNKKKHQIHCGIITFSYSPKQVQPPSPQFLGNLRGPTFRKATPGGWAPRTCESWWSDHPPFISHFIRPFVRGTTPVRGLNNHGYEPLSDWDDPPSTRK